MTGHKTDINYTLVNQTINIYKSNKGSKNLKTSPQKKFNENIQSTSNNYALFKSVNEKSEDLKTI